MALVSCKLCRKLFDARGGRICTDCLNRLDEVYAEVRSYLRDHPKEDFNVEAVADAVDADIRDVQELVDQGYFERDIPEGSASAAAKSEREKLAKAFEQSIDQLKATVAAQNRPTITYGQSVYSKDRKH